MVYVVVQDTNGTLAVNSAHRTKQGAYTEQKIARAFYPRAMLIEAKGTAAALTEASKRVHP